MGEVYRARDPRLGRDVAIKVLSASHAERERVARFEYEARAAGGLNHPNIVVVYDVGEHEGLPYVVQELLEGETLRSRLRKGPLTVRKALDCATQVAQGLSATHEKGISHRDLKPENLFITNDGRVKILDFGLAKLAPRSPLSDGETSSPTLPGTEPGTVLGTVGYMAPEQVRGQGSDWRVDIFSLGAVLYEMLSGQKAFLGQSAADVMSAILREDPPPIPESGRHFPPALLHIVQHCLEKDPDERFQSARDLAFDLQEVQRQWTTGETVVPPKPTRWRRLALPVLAALGLGVAAAAMLWVARTISEGSPAVFEQITFRRGTVLSARLAPDAQSVVYSAAWEGPPVEVFRMRPGLPESRPLGYSGAKLLAVSTGGELALCLGYRYVGGERFGGTLARVPLNGGVPRELLEDVADADWSPDGTQLAVVRSSGVGGPSRLDYPIGTPLYETSGAIRDLRVSPEGQQVAFFDDPGGLRSSGAVVVVDSAGTKRTLTQHWDSAHGLAWHPDGDEIWYTAADRASARALRAVSLSGDDRVVARIPGALTLHDLGPRGTALVARDEERLGILGLPPGGEAETDLSWFDESGVGDISRDGQVLLFGDRNGVYLRRMDGSPAVRLGGGFADALSPDGEWALTTSIDARALVLLPTGPGVPRTLRPYTIESYAGAHWLPDGKSVLFSGSEPDRGLRAYVQDLAGGSPRPVTPEGVWAQSLSPDGTLFAVTGPDQGILLHPLDGGPGRLVPGSEPGDIPTGWTEDARTLWVFRRSQVPAPVFRLDIATGRRDLWKRLAPVDSAGVVSISGLRITADGTAYAYTFRRVRSALYLAEGLR